MNVLQQHVIDTFDRFMLAFERGDEPAIFELGLKFRHTVARAKGAMAYPVGG